MDSTQKEHSEAIQERFPEVYQKFFADHDVVVSNSFIHSMNNDVSWRIGAPCIEHKLPFRAYIGIRAEGKPGTITIGLTKFFNVAKNEFNDSDHESLDWTRTIPYLEKFLADKLAKKDFKGITIDILTERAEDRGFYVAVPILIVTALYLYFNIIDSATASKLVVLPGKETHSPQTESGKMFQDLFTEARKVSYFSAWGVIGGSVAYSSFIDSKSPTVYFTEERAGSVKKPFNNFPPVDFSGNIERIKDLKWWGFRLDELKDVHGELPLDAVSIFPGSSRIPYSSSEYISRVILPSFDKLRDDTKEIFQNVDISEQEHLPNFLKNLETDGNYWQEYARGQVYAQLFFLRSLLNLYEHKLSTGALDEFFEVINLSMSINAPFEESPSLKIQYILEEIKKKAREKNISVGIHVLNWGKQDGNIIIFSQPKSFRSEIKEIVNDLQKHYNPDIHIDFASWRDGWGEDGLRVEQFISKGIYSKFTSPDSLQLTAWNKGVVKSSIIDRKDINPKNFDLLLDQTYEKVYVGGKAITSKQIPSQKATIEILSALLVSEGHCLRNRTLPESSYAKYRNELQGKIVGPLVDVVQKRLKKDLKLKIKGTLMDFEISFDLKGLNVALVKELK